MLRTLLDEASSSSDDEVEPKKGKGKVNDSFMPQ